MLSKYYTSSSMVYDFRCATMESEAFDIKERKGLQILLEENKVHVLRLVGANINSTSLFLMTITMRFNTLTSLCLDNAGLEDMALTFLPIAADHSNLEDLSLQYNKITDIGMEWLAKGLEKNFMLSRLNLSGNKFGNEGLLLLCDAKINHSLKELCLNRVGITSSVFGALVGLLARTNISKMPISVEEIGLQQIQKLDDIIQTKEIANLSKQSSAISFAEFRV